MCGRYTLAKGEKVLEVVPNVTVREDVREVGELHLWEGRWNIAPTQPVLVVANELYKGSPIAQPMQWGLVPSWAKDVSIGSRMINARAETLVEKPFFRRCLERWRCAIIADGFYEWKKEGGSKGPMYVRMKDGHPFAFAGLWESWHGDGGELRTCTIITTSSNKLMKSIHDRMPVILPREGLLDWLDPQERSAKEMEEWLHPYPAGEMEAYPVSRAVNDVKNQGAELVAPAEGAPRQKTSPKKRTAKAKDEGQGNLF
jgi:putative SOS response-associated peptidase YedK